MTLDDARALVEQIREEHEACESRPGESPFCVSCAPRKWPCDAVRAADALEGALTEPEEGAVSAVARPLEVLPSERAEPTGRRS